MLLNINRDIVSFINKGSIHMTNHISQLQTRNTIFSLSLPGICINMKAICPMLCKDRLTIGVFKKLSDDIRD